MIVTLQTERIQTVEQVRAFLEGSAPVDYLPQDRDGVYAFVRRTLVRIRYHTLGRSGKGAVRAYLAKTTGRSRAQVTRLIAQHRAADCRSPRGQQRAALRADLHGGRHPPVGRGRRDRQPDVRSDRLRGDAARL